jgi:hypothetical protein
MGMLGLQNSHLLLIHTNFGSGTVLMAACAWQGCCGSGCCCCYIKTEFLFFEPLETTTTVRDIFKVSYLFEERVIQWKNLYALCLDRAPAILGCRSGFRALIKTCSKCQWVALCDPWKGVGCENFSVSFQTNHVSLSFKP